MKNNFDNLRKLLPECLAIHKRLEAWRDSDIATDESVKVFKEYVKDNNKVVEKVAKAFHEDTKGYNSWRTIYDTMLVKSREGDISECKMTYPFLFVTKTLGLEYMIEKP